ncbi:MAG TPA: FAD-dependent oxidoreductase, partial [Thermoanaerobaculia bacterium]
SVRDFLRARRRSLSVADRRLLVSLVEGYDAAPIASASAHALSTSGEPMPGPDARAQFRLLGGYGGLIDALASEIGTAHCRVVLSAVIQTIAWERGRVRLRTAREEFQARRAVITVPVGVLGAPTGARGAIAFDPDPPALRAALSGLAMGHAVRLVLRFRDAFWRERPAQASSGERPLPPDAAFLHLPSSACFSTWWTTAPFEAPVLTAWAGGPAAERLRRLRPEAMLSTALGDLSRALAVPRGRVSRRLLDWQSHDWSSDPFSRGAYSFARVGGAASAEALSAPIAGTLYFAGEACGREETGTVAAAIESGRRAAARAAR